MIPSSVMAKMASLGFSEEQASAVAEMLSAVELATKAESGEAIAARRQSDRDRKAKQRHGKSRDVTGQDVTSEDKPSSSSPKRKVSPCTPSKENTPSPPPVSEPIGSSTKHAVATTALEFAETFWPAYPHKIGKPEALKKFEIARRDVDLEAIMAGLLRYIAAKPPDRSWCNPATWLHQQRWADEPAPNQVSPGNQRHPPPPNVPSLSHALAAIERLRAKLPEPEDDQIPHGTVIDAFAFRRGNG